MGSVNLLSAHGLLRAAPFNGLVAGLGEAPAMPCGSFIGGDAWSQSQSSNLVEMLQSGVEPPLASPSGIGKTVFRVPRPTPPPLTTSSPIGCASRFQAALRSSVGDARAVLRVAQRSSPVSNGLLPYEKRIMWILIIDGSDITVQVFASMAGHRRIVINGQQVHEERKPLTRLCFGPTPIPGSYPHTVKIEQALVSNPFQFELTIDGAPFEVLTQGSTPMARDRPGMCFDKG